MTLKKLLTTMIVIVLLSFTANSQTATALNFSSANSNVVGTTDPAFGNGDFTIEMWIRPTNFSGGYIATNRTYEYNAPGSWWALHSGAGITLETGQSNIGSQMVVATATTVITQNAWNHVAVVRSGLTYSIFVNGVFEASNSDATARNLTSGYGIMRFGGWMEPGLAFYDGDIDELRTWNVARSATDIAASASCELNLGVTQTGLLNYFRFNEGIAAGNNTTVTTATDDGPSNQPGTLINFALTGTTSNWVSGTPVNTLPVISVSDATVCSGITATITPSGADTYTITGGSFTVALQTTTAFSITGTSTAGCVSSNTAVATISVNATPSLSVNNATICSGDSVAIVTSGASTYTITGGNFTVSPAATTVYSVTGTSTDNCVSDAITSTVLVNVTPTLVATNATVCSGNQLVITPTGADTYTITGGSFTVNPSTTTSYSITGTNTTGCAASNTAVTTVSVFTTPTISVNDTTICSGVSVVLAPSGAFTYSINGGTFTVSPTTDTTYSITGVSGDGCTSSNVVATVSVYTSPTVSINSGSICSGASFTLTPTGANSYTITGGNYTVTPSSTTSYSVAGTGTNGCLSSNAISTVTVNATPTISVNSATICSGNTVIISPTGANSYTITGGTFTVNPAAITDYSITGTSANGCVSNEATVSVNVLALPAVSVTAASGTICVGETTSLTATGAMSYSWNTSGSTAVIVIAPIMNTTYTVTGTDANGCSQTTTITEVTNLCTGIKQNAQELISGVYPNPNAGEFVIKTKEQVEVSVINSLGQTVYNEKTTGNSTTISITQLANGIYFVKAVANGGQQIVKIVKQ